MAKTATSKHPQAEGRAFLQRRVGNLGLILSFIGIAFVIMRLVVVLAVGRPERLASMSMLVHYGGVLVTFAMWLACRRSERSRLASLAIELAGMVGCCSLYALMAVDIPQTYRPEMTILLAFGVFLLAHAVRVPCSWKWTTALGAGMGLPLIIGAWLILNPMDPRIVAASAAAPGSIQRTAAGIIGIGMASVVTWWVIIVGTAAAASAVIYGLRREVREARQFGQYTIERKLGEGAMGVVYRANHAMLRRPTAVKLLLPARMDDESLVRFEREVRSTARLSHPNTVTIYDYGRTSDGLFYYAMELLEGASLAEVVELSGPMPAQRALRVLHQMAGALAEAHELGLVHRDIKPANVMLTSQGGVADVAKVVDFGLVKRTAGATDDTTADPTVSIENAIVGTPLCLAPEVIRGKNADEAGRDLYALGCVAYYLLTGEYPFVAKSAVEVCAMHMNTEPEPLTERLGRPVPADLEDLVHELLHKQVDARPESAAAVLRALEGCADFGSWTQRDARRWWRKWGEQLREHRLVPTGTSADISSELTIDVRRLAESEGETTRKVEL